jgi:hypothetical protein
LSVVLNLIGRHWDYNGAHFGHVTKDLSIKHFFGNKKIRDLEVYPLAYYEEANGKGSRERLITRGMEWRTILDVTHREYDGKWKEEQFQKTTKLTQWL